jgi:hypothetical protein
VTLAALANVLVQPLTGDDLVKVGTVLFAGTAAVIYAWRGGSNAKTDIASQVALIHNMVSNLLLATKPPESTSTTTTLTETPADAAGKQVTTTTTTKAATTTKPVNPALVDTVAGMPVVPPKPAAPLRVQT